jgi:hypothetical protein
MLWKAKEVQLQGAQTQTLQEHLNNVIGRLKLESKLAKTKCGYNSIECSGLEARILQPVM